MKYTILTFLFIFIPNLFAVTLPSNPVNMAPIISYLLSDSTPTVIQNTGTLDTSFGTDGIVFFAPGYLRQKFGDHPAIIGVLEMFAKRPPTEIPGPFDG